ncbi:DUF3060 domain-containing protein [bacterium]|nr:DUF3060 domain-containing protein [bacterium]
MGSNSINSNLNSFFTKVLQQGIADKNKDGVVSNDEKAENDALLGFSRDVEDLFSLTSEGNWEEALELAENIDIAAKQETANQLSQEFDVNGDNKIDMSEIEDHELYSGLTNIFTDATTTFKMEDFENYAEMLDINEDNNIDTHEKNIFNSLVLSVKTGNVEGYELEEQNQSNIMAGLQQSILGNELEDRLITAMKAFNNTAKIQCAEFEATNVIPSGIKNSIEDLKVGSVEFFDYLNLFDVDNLDSVEYDEQGRIAKCIGKDDGREFAISYDDENNYFTVTEEVVENNQPNGVVSYSKTERKFAYDIFLTEFFVYNETKDADGSLMFISTFGTITNRDGSYQLVNNDDDVVRIVSYDKDKNVTGGKFVFPENDMVILGNYAFINKNNDSATVSFTVNENGEIVINADDVEIMSVEEFDKQGLFSYSPFIQVGSELNGVEFSKIILNGNNNILTLTNSDDSITVYGNSNTINALDGNDNITVIGSDNVIDGGLGEDNIVVDSANNTILNDDDLDGISDVGSLNFYANIFGPAFDINNYTVAYDDYGRVISLVNKSSDIDDLFGCNVSISYDDENQEIIFDVDDKYQTQNVYSYIGRLINHSSIIPRGNDPLAAIKFEHKFNDDGTSIVVCTQESTGMHFIQNFDEQGQLITIENDGMSFDASGINKILGNPQSEGGMRSILDISSFLELLSRISLDDEIDEIDISALNYTIDLLINDAEYSEVEKNQIFEALKDYIHGAIVSPEHTPETYALVEGFITTAKGIRQSWQE